METKICKICERELPETCFPMNRWGKRAGVCTECRTAAMRENKAQKRAQTGGGGKPLPFQIRTSTDAQSETFGARCAVRRSGLKAVVV